MGSYLVSGTWILIVKVQRDSGFLALHYGFQAQDASFRNKNFAD